MTKKLLSNKFVWVFLAFMLFLLPVAIDQAPQTRDRSVVIGVGLDKKNEEYIFSTKILEPTLNQGRYILHLVKTVWRQCKNLQLIWAKFLVFQTQVLWW